MSKANPQTPLLIALALVAAGIVIAAIGGLKSGSIGGGLLAGSGIIPACYAAWAGTQQETQKSLAASLLMVLVSVVVGGALILLAIFDWLI